MVVGVGCGGGGGIGVGVVNGSGGGCGCGAVIVFVGVAGVGAVDAVWCCKKRQLKPVCLTRLLSRDRRRRTNTAKGGR